MLEHVLGNKNCIFSNQTDNLIDLQNLEDEKEDETDVECGKNTISTVQTT